MDNVGVGFLILSIYRQILIVFQDCFLKTFVFHLSSTFSVISAYSSMFCHKNNSLGFVSQCYRNLISVFVYARF